MKLYIAGPMTGLDELNYPAFENAAKLLREAGYKIVSPHEFVLPESQRIIALKWDVREITLSDGIATLEGCENSEGAKFECYIANFLEIPVKSVEDWLKEK